MLARIRAIVESLGFERNFHGSVFVWIAMKNRVLQPLLFLFAAVTLMGADATGTWKGQLIPSDGDGSGRPAHLVLKQDGTKLTGTAGPDSGEQHPIQNGKAEGGTLTFEVPTGGTVMKFSLKQEGDEITGDIEREREGQRQTAKLSVKREN
jgi:hypothetical protein